jgi:tetratricopeptide (TPR) repeat protein
MKIPRARSLAILLLLSPCAFAQHDHSSASAAPRPAQLLSGMGSLHHPIATSSPEAQRFFDQGLTLIYAFNHDEAVRSFRRAAELDPKAAMPWWGISNALGPNYNDPADPERRKAAFDALQKAKLLAAAGPENERAYVEALAPRYSDDPKADAKKLAVDYAKAMGELAKKYPDDPDAATIYAESMMDIRPWGLWSLDGAPAEGTQEIISVLESVLARFPNHIGANHYYIHAVEASPHAAWGLPSADRLGMLVPGAGHLVHMPAHIYSRVGDFRSAQASNENAAAVDIAYIQATGARGMYPAMYYSHNLHFLAYAAMQAGNYRTARQAAAELAENIHQRAQGMPRSMTEGFLTYQVLVQLRFRKWQEILSASAPDPGFPMLRTISHFARGMALASTGKLSDAEAERKAFVSAAEVVPADQTFGFGSAKTVLQIPADMLDAQIAEAHGDRRAAIDLLKKAVTVEDGLAYNEPPDWYYSVRESLGGSLLRDGQSGEAERVFRHDLARNPRNGRSLFGLWQALKAQNKTADAEWVRREFELAWKDADTQLSVGDL